MARRQATQFRQVNRGAKQSASFGGIKGQNGNVLPQLLGADQAITKTNYIQDGQGVSESRNGAKKLAEKAGISGFTDGDWWFGDNFVVAYGTTVAVINKATGITTEVKTDFTLDVTAIAVYGNYVFVASGYRGDKLFRIGIALDYDTQTGNFATNLILTDSTSGATARIFADADAGTTGTLTIGDVDNTFGDTNIITDSATGSATVDGALYFTATEVSDSVPAKKLFIKTSEGGAKPGSRLVLGQADGNKKQVVFTGVDENALIPWDTSTLWDTAPVTPSPETAGFIIIARDVEAITSRGNSFIIGSKNSRTPFSIGSTTTGATQVIDIQIGWEYKDHGLEAAIDTSHGTFYLENGGFRKMISTNKDEQLSDELGSDYFDDITLENASLVHDTKNNLILATYAKNSVSNNETLAYNTKTKAITIFKGWNFNVLLKDDSRIYGLSSISGKLYKVFEGFEDDGKGIPTELTLNVQNTSFIATSVLNRLDFQAVLFEGEELKIHIDIEEPQGGFIPDYDILTITGKTPTSQLLSWGSASYGSAGWGGGAGGTSRLSRKYHTDDLNIEFVSARLRILSNLKTPHILNTIIAQLESGNPLNLNNIN